MLIWFKLDFSIFNKEKKKQLNMLCAHVHKETLECKHLQKGILTGISYLIHV